MYIDLFGEAFFLLAMSEGRYKAAAYLIGYADRVSATMGVHLELDMHKSTQMIEARAALDRTFEPEALRRLMAAGHALSHEDVCDLTLATSNDDERVGSAIGQQALGRMALT